MKINLFLMLLILLFACKEKEEAKPVQVDSTSVIVLNEGNFRSGNASISAYQPNSKEVQLNVFQNNNSGRLLGDVAQSIQEIAGKLFVVLNNSNKIEVLDKSNFQSLGQINNLNSPRYILPINASKAYVSDLYSDEITIINPSSLAKIGSIASKGWTEEMVLYKNKAFVCQVDSNQIWVIDVNNDSVIAKINTNISPQHLQFDADTNLWVSCSGGYNLGFPALIQLNPRNYAVLKTLEIQDVSKSIGSIGFSANKTELYYLSSDLFKIAVADNSLPSSPYITANGRIFYGFAVDPDNGELYLSDAIDYQQAGWVFRYDASAQLIDEFRVGIIPGFFYFQ